MIKITSFYPFSNLLRVTQEFYEDKAIIEMKSLTYDREFEFNYSELGEISDAYYVSDSQSQFGFWLLAFTSLYLIFLHFIYPNLFLIRIGQILYILAILLYITSFFKSCYIIFSDKNDNFLTRIKQTRHNHDLIVKVIETIKNNSEDLQETSSTSPFPDVKPSFEHIAYNNLNTKKTIDRFYENKILGFQKSIVGENVYSIKYSQLSGKVYRGKIGNKDDQGCVLSIGVFLGSFFSGLVFGFSVFPKMAIIYFAFVFGLLAIFSVSFILKFMKQEIVGLYDLNGDIEYWTRTNRSNKEKFEEIIKYVQSRIPGENKEVSSKE